MCFPAALGDNILVAAATISAAYGGYFPAAAPPCGAFRKPKSTLSKTSHEVTIMHTCAALSSGAGKAGVAVIRLSGDDAVKIASAVFRPKNGKTLEDCPARFAMFGTAFAADGKKIDTGLATVFRQPHSYTGENTVEISCHGSPVGTSLILGALFAAGAKPALPGEFTKRAFINGKLDLTQAEAVGDLLDAESADELRLFSAQLEGGLGKKIRAAADKITALLAAVYAFIDYPDEDMSDVTDEEMAAQIERLSQELRALCATYAAGRAVTQGLYTVIAGAPNTGKSTFFNRLAGNDRAIVTDIAGTTRDIITETVVCAGIKLRLADTAGLRETADTVEKIGVERSERALEESELIFAVFDGSRDEITAEETAFIAQLAPLAQQKPVVAFINKTDIAPGEQINRWETALRDAGIAHILPFSAKNGSLTELENHLHTLFPLESDALEHGLVLTNARQYAAVQKAVACLENAQNALKALTRDMAGLDLEEALGALNEADGRQVSEQVVSTIFAHFCVGK